MSDKNEQLERERFELEREKFELDKEKQKLEQLRAQVDERRASNETIDRLLSIIRYLNDIQDDQVTVVNGITKESLIKEGRIWNAHEEDIANSCLMSLKQQIKALVSKK